MSIVGVAISGKKCGDFGGRHQVLSDGNAVAVHIKLRPVVGVVWSSKPWITERSERFSGRHAGQRHSSTRLQDRHEGSNDFAASGVIRSGFARTAGQFGQWLQPFGRRKSKKGFDFTGTHGHLAAWE
jgi:hypothetical protein